MNELYLGLGISPAASPDADPIADARLAESFGFDFVSTSDHLHGPMPTFEPWTLLTAIAASTTRLRVAPRVLGVPYRNPAVVAKMAESLDRLSGGRLILGLGAGAMDEEFRAFGLPVGPIGDKIDGLEEAIRITRGLWGDSPYTFEGRIHHTDGARLEPKPEHPIPIWLGMYKRRGLSMTGRLADGWIPSYGYAPPDVIGGLRDEVIRAAREAGRDPSTVRCIYNITVRIDERGTASSTVISGSLDQVAERLVKLSEIGFDGFNLIPTGPGLGDQIERIGRELVPALRGLRARSSG